MAGYTKNGKRLKPRRRYRKALVVRKTAETALAKLPRGLSASIIHPLRRTLAFTTTSWSNPINGVYFKTYTFKLNSVLASGPQEDWAGAFANNCPTGIATMLGSVPSTGSFSPYYQFLVHKASMKVTMEAFTTNNSAPTFLIIVPSSSSNFAAMTIDQIREQPFAREKIINNTTTGEVIALSNTISMRKLFGWKYPSTIEAGLYNGNYNTDPGVPAYFHVVIGSVVGSAGNINGYAQFKLDQQVELYNRNILTSSPPV